MSTRNIVPRANEEGSIGTTLKRWLSGFFKYINILNYIQFIPNGAPDYQEGRMFYDSINKCLSFYIDHPDITHNLGREFLVRVYNGTGVQINDGQVVRLADVGATSSVILAKADTEDNAKGTLGMVTGDMPHGSTGYVTLLGEVHNLDTSTYVKGDRLYLSDTVAGGVTKMKPPITVFVGYVVESHATEGIIFINISETFAGLGDMLKVTYDSNDDGKVNSADDSDKLGGSTKTQVQDHTPKAHTHTESEITDLEHNAVKIQGKNVDAPQAGDDGKIYVYNETGQKFSLDKKGIYYSDYTEDETESTTTDSVNWQQKLRLSYIAEKTGNYMIYWTAEIANTSTNKGTQVRLEEDDTTELNMTTAFSPSADYFTISGFKRVTISDTNPHTFDLDFKVDTTGTAKIRRARIHIAKVK